MIYLCSFCRRDLLSLEGGVYFSEEEWACPDCVFQARTHLVHAEERMKPNPPMRYVTEAEWRAEQAARREAEDQDWQRLAGGGGE